MPAVVTAPSFLALLRRRPALLLWALYIALAPFYVVHNGLPQPGDLLIVLLVPVSLSGWNGRLASSSARTIRPLLWFTFWVCAIDIFWSLVLGNFGLDLLFPAYYLYNAAIVLCAVVLYERYREEFLRVTLYSVYWIVLFQVAASFVMRGGGTRKALFFGNPNELGYYSLLAGCVIAVIQRPLRFGLLRSSIGITACAYLAVISASRSAVAGLALLFVLLVFASPRVLVGATLVVVALMIVGGGSVEKATGSLQQRIEEKRNGDLNFFEQRGYDRIWANREYVLLGAGEGANWRFRDTTAIGVAEIHSSAGTIVFSYGIVGTLLFGWFLFALVKGSAFRSALMLAPAGIYTFAHQGLRFTTLWVLVAVFIALKTPGAQRNA